MERHIQLTDDGSHTIGLSGTKVTYHSTHGALQESMHIFIQAGLRPLLQQHTCLHIFEMGFGTGLNALLTLQEVIAAQQPVYYETVELYPLSAAEVQALNYDSLLNIPATNCNLVSLHEAPWEQEMGLHPLFTLYKRQLSLAQYLSAPVTKQYHLIYFDAFAPEIQPELWSPAVFEHLAARMYPGAALVTYCSKGVVRRAMQSAGLQVTKQPGPPGKREIVVSRKL
ncbi:tRNA (5-methylaminomethyl-2-thiouridine)(34)-methyltransferase MnmD [Chitinophaga agrisoli]|uniref:tRNA (5-methylaminomethyl-2-thiouridine)(34)-methyltransferase MnmD n=1 Tax=Chitinophaga agrisoli TaxID=2607653 RepID=A0A5B2VX75_9BACT|nr:tRNA (5-methylaminomethyl-2-thiouridine)(34)-methyltransferase MnmD [Chitinophaga agrisoli]KAA2243210.1 tRNA (5-methylaminomethyl-2-thiouridine)(34)-methyltransferase MnmD [Chitinophaga agrisoli]